MFLKCMSMTDTVYRECAPKSRLNNLCFFHFHILKIQLLYNLTKKFSLAVSYNV